MASAHPFFRILLSLLLPWQFLGIAISYLPGALKRLLQTEPLQNLSLAKIQDAWFSAFWNHAGANIRVMNGPRITALLEGRVSQARVVDKPVVAPVSGVILDIGPGPGFWVDLYVKANTGDLKVYGVEPNVDAHSDLRMRVHQAGLDGVYNIIPAGIETIDKIEATGIDGKTHKIEKGSVDCIVTLLCLCGIPKPEKNIAELYQYLKKGGRWYVFEHVKHNGNWFMRLYQAIVNLFWPHVVGGCELCRDTEQSLRNAGSWDRIDLMQPPEETWFMTVPHRFGTLTK
ncbi:methyltransferase [Bimuria novae-zelandiae CBS 107.79]|uniref:Methyltransferase n=1 Tax=Bimuria novae-zelandiae CBS 107.79 TaxID=1447943 RepID=A0A6A5VJC5_9PLEO|nr:methyltransferase [Bimuria novae-zelandiae CBS 107.79]